MATTPALLNAILRNDSAAVTAILDLDPSLIETPGIPAGSIEWHNFGPARPLEVAVRCFDYIHNEFPASGFQYANPEIVELLVARGANVNAICTGNYDARTLALPEETAWMAAHPALPLRRSILDQAYMTRSNALRDNERQNLSEIIQYLEANGAVRHYNNQQGGGKRRSRRSKKYRSRSHAKKNRRSTRRH